jgi:hypothetical protein
LHFLCMRTGKTTLRTEVCFSFIVGTVLDKIVYASVARDVITYRAYVRDLEMR